MGKYIKSVFWVKAECHTSLSGCFRFSSRWTRPEWRCSRTQPSQTTSQRKRTAPRGRWTGPSPAPRPRAIPTGPGWAPLPASSRKPSTGESRAAQPFKVQPCKAALTADDGCATGEDYWNWTTSHTDRLVCWLIPTLSTLNHECVSKNSTLANVQNNTWTSPVSGRTRCRFDQYCDVNISFTFHPQNVKTYFHTSVHLEHAFVFLSILLWFY